VQTSIGGKSLGGKRSRRRASDAHMTEVIVRCPRRTALQTALQGSELLTRKARCFADPKGTEHRAPRTVHFFPIDEVFARCEKEGPSTSHASGARCTLSSLPRYDMTMNTTLLEEAKRLSMEERVQLVAAIWDTVAEDATTGDLPLPDSHRLELDRRLDDRRSNPEAESPWTEVADRLRKR
jgi:putative addiction module component (TIGR02574 family)